MNLANSAVLVACCIASSALTTLAVQESAQPAASELVRCKRIEIVDGEGRTRIVLGDQTPDAPEGEEGGKYELFGLTVLAPEQEQPAIVVAGGRDLAFLGGASSTGFRANLTVIDDCAIFELSDGAGKESAWRVTETSCEIEMRDSTRGDLVLGGPNRPLSDDEEQRFFGLNVEHRLGGEAFFDARGVHEKALRPR